MSSISFQEMAERAGLTPQQLGGKVYKQLLGVALDEELDSVKTARAECDGIDARYSSLARSSYDQSQTIDKLDRRLDALRRKVSETQKEIESQTDFIDDKPTRMGVLAYREILRATVDVFGEDKMTEAVMCKAIEEAGYGAWRSIMGPKTVDQKRYS